MSAKAWHCRHCGAQSRQDVWTFWSLIRVDGPAEAIGLSFVGNKGLSTPPAVTAATHDHWRRGGERGGDRSREYDRRRGPSPARPLRPMHGDRDRGHDRDRGYDRDRGNRSPQRFDRGKDRRGLGRDRSPVLKKARYGRSRSPGRRGSKSPERDGAARRR